MTLEGGRCPTCGTSHWPFRYACRNDATALERVVLSGRGSLYSWTTVRVGPSGFDAPYALGFVVLEEGPRVLAKLPGASPGGLAVGAPYTVVVDADGDLSATAAD